jgi:hypothetical protein
VLETHEHEKNGILYKQVEVFDGILKVLAFCILQCLGRQMGTNHFDITTYFNHVHRT